MEVNVLEMMAVVHELVQKHGACDSITGSVSGASAAPFIVGHSYGGWVTLRWYYKANIIKRSLVINAVESWQ